MTDQPILEGAVEAAEMEALYTCAKCDRTEPLLNLGRTIEGKRYCIECSLHLTREGATNEVREENSAQQQRIETQEEKQAKRDRSRRIKIGLLAASLTLIVIEAGLLVLTRPAEPMGDQQVKVEFSSTFMVYSALERYKENVGSYPVILDQLIPKFWRSSEQGELQKYAYLRTAGSSFLLERVTPGLAGPAEPAAGPPAVQFTVDDQTRFSELFVGMGQ